MKLRPYSDRGFTLIEIAIVVAILGVLVLVGLMSIDFESGAAAIVESTQGSVETVIRQGMAHTELAATHATVINGTDTYVTNHVINGNPQVSTFTCNAGATTCTLTLADGKVATYTINADATVDLTTLTGFSDYAASSGTIARI